MSQRWAEMSPGAVLYRRFAPGEALVAGLDAFARAEGIRTAVITSCIGSITRLELRNLCRAGTGIEGEFDVQRHTIDEIMEVVSAEGHIVPLPEGGIRTHIHIVAARPSGETVGGHCEEATVGTAAYLFLQVLERDGASRAGEESR